MRARRSCRTGTQGAGERGSVAVEFALILVPFLTLVFGAVQYGYYFFERQAVVSGAREGARLAAVGYSTCPAFKSSLTARITQVTLLSGATAFVPASPTVGGQVSVSLTFKPTNFTFPFLPFISGNQTFIATSRVEQTLTGEASCALTFP